MAVAINTKSRADLKDYFLTGSRPTAAQFAQLIDAMLNAKDDSMVKTNATPLRLQAEQTGEDDSLFKVVEFYKNFQEDTQPIADFSIVQPNGTEKGLSINMSGNSALFIDTTGKLWVNGAIAAAGAITATAGITTNALTVNGANGIVMTNGGISVGSGLTIDASGNVTKVGAITADSGITTNALTVNGSDGIVTTNGGISVGSGLTIDASGNITKVGTITANGLITADGGITANGGISIADTQTLTFAGGTRQMISFRDDTFGIGVEEFSDSISANSEAGAGASRNTVYFKSPDCYAWYIGASVRMFLTDAELYLGTKAVNVSDKRLKENIEPLAYGLEQIKQLLPVSYDWKDRDNPKRSIGLLAQDLIGIMDEAVSEMPQGDSSVFALSYNSLIPVLINAVKELDQKLEAIQLKIAQLPA